MNFYSALLVTSLFTMSGSTFAAHSKTYVECSANVSKLDLKEVIKSEKTTTQRFDLEPFDSDGRTQAKGLFSFAGGYELIFSVTRSPQSSLLIEGAD